MASSHEAASEALRVLLAGIVAGVNGAVNTPSRVRRVNVYGDNPLDDSQSIEYLIRPGEETVRVAPDGCKVVSELETFILVAQKYTASIVPDIVRWQMAADMVADVLNAILTGPIPAFTLGGTAVTVYDFRVDYERFVPTWAVAEIRCVIRHRHDRDGGR